MLISKFIPSTPISLRDQVQYFENRAMTQFRLKVRLRVLQLEDKIHCGMLCHKLRSECKAGKQTPE